MEGPFTYSQPITGQKFIGRDTVSRTLSNLLTQGENILISEPPKSGKGSLIRHTLLNMKGHGCTFIPVFVDLMNIRSKEDFAIRLGSETLKSAYGTPGDYCAAASQFLSGTHFIFDSDAFSRTGEALSLNWEMDEQDICAIITLPYRIAESLGRKIFVILDEFQNIALTGENYMICRAFETVFSGLTAQMRTYASYILSGSRINAMDQIFRGPSRLGKFTERVKLDEIDTRVIIDHVIKGFNASGKIIDRELLLGACKLFRNNIYYINHFCAICDSLTRGYIMEGILKTALDTLISIHIPRFTSMMYDLTGFQASFLKAILEGHSKFSSTDIIEQYKLNSSANVLRVKEALCKKEIIFFDETGKPIVIDPLFEYWARTEYYGIKI